jgi:putative ABC transport system substrate-binding protein
MTGGSMRRRQFLGLLGGAAVSPIAARAQQGKLPTIGVLGTGTSEAWRDRTAAFVDRLTQLGWIDGKSVTIEYRWSDARNETFARIAEEFVRAKVDVILTAGAAGRVVKQATSTIPVVLAIANDPVGAGLVESLSRPGGNITGLSLQTPDLAGKRLELLRELMPQAHRVAVLADLILTASKLEMDEVERVAAPLGLDIVRIEAREATDVAPALKSLGGSVDALYICTGPTINGLGSTIGDVARVIRLPSVAGDKAYVETGGLLSYGPVVTDMYRRAADLVDKTLRGAKPGDIPIEQTTKFEMVVNLKTANAIGLTISPALLARADQVIE